MAVAVVVTAMVVPMFVVMTAIPVFMVMVVVIAMGVRVVSKRSLRERLCRLVRASLHAGVELDADVGQRHLRAHADAAANQRVDLGRLQESRQRAVPASVGINDLLSRDFSVFYIVQLELFRMSEVLKNLSVVISNRDSHCHASFLHNILPDFHRRKFTAASGDQEPLPMNEGLRDLLPRAVVNSSDRVGMND